MEPTVVIFPTEANDFQEVEQHDGWRWLIQVKTQLEELNSRELEELLMVLVCWMGQSK